MNLTLQESSELIKSILAGLSHGSDGEPEIMIAPPFTKLSLAANLLKGSRVRLGAQDMHWEASGAFTGEVSGIQLKDVGCTHVILGHSERRRHFVETDAVVQKKLQAAIKCGLIPVVCIGETLREREAGKTFEVLEAQVKGSLGGFNAADLSTIVVAYEPVWAIGTGKTATPDQAQEAHVFVRGRIADIYGKGLSESVRILYGGSVTPDNIDSLMVQPDVDGALVGGASLKSASFLRIIHFKAPEDLEKASRSTAHS